jgi:hypothetical protein
MIVSEHINVGQRPHSCENLRFIQDVTVIAIAEGFLPYVNGDHVVIE